MPRAARASSRSTPTLPAPAPADSDALSQAVDGLCYSLDAPPRRQGRRSVLTVRLAASGGDAPLVDRADLYSYRSRERLARLVADVFGRDASTILGHLALLLDHAERHDARAPRAPVDVLLTDARRRAADELLRAPDLLERAALALEALGVVGEARPARLALLVAVSRLLARPLSALFVAPAGSGKSTVLDAVARLTPPEHTRMVERLTAASLFYMGPDALRHRLLLVDELEGQAEASHPLRVLQSRGELKLEATVAGKVEAFVCTGPVAVMSGTTTGHDLDVQNASRCLLVSLDDGHAQTEAVQAAQRRAWAGRASTSVDVTPWHDAQRLLAEVLPARVVIPFAERLAFPARATTDRRASARVLGLVAAHATLCQRRRARDHDGRVVATVDDYRAVFALVRPLVDDDRDGLSPRAVTLLRALPTGARGVARVDAAKLLGGSYATARRAIDELVDREALRPVAGEYPRRWRLVDAVSHALDQAGGLTDPSELK